MEQATERYRSGLPPLQLTGRSIVLVDDGLASGATAAAALDSARQQGAGRLVFATPVASAGGLATIRRRAEDVCCLEEVHDFGMVSDWYEDFSPPSDADVVTLLRQGHHT